MEDGGSGLRLLYCTPEKVVTSKRFFAKWVRCEALACSPAHVRLLPVPESLLYLSYDCSMQLPHRWVAVLVGVPAPVLLNANTITVAGAPSSPPTTHRLVGWRRFTKRGGWIVWQ